MVFAGCDFISGENTVNFNEENDLQNVQISIIEDNGESKELENINTADTGEVSLDLANGSYKFNASKEHYDDYSKTFIIDGEDKIIDFKMMRDLNALVNNIFEDKDGVSYYGTTESVVIEIDDGVDAEIQMGLMATLQGLGFSDAIFDRMTRTRALDGTQTAEGDRVNASWTFHSDHGLQIVFEVVK